jgi:hypothetical protein
LFSWQRIIRFVLRNIAWLLLFKFWYLLFMLENFIHLYLIFFNIFVLYLISWSFFSYLVMWRFGHDYLFRLFYFFLWFFVLNNLYLLMLLLLFYNILLYRCFCYFFNTINRLFERWRENYFRLNMLIDRIITAWYLLLILFPILFFLTISF